MSLTAPKPVAVTGKSTLGCKGVKTRNGRDVDDTAWVKGICVLCEEVCEAVCISFVSFRRQNQV